jgi:acetylornithine deacetylase/succinyl-diaminopimelate desuccinylase-like protein
MADHSLTNALGWARTHTEQALAQYEELLRIPSISNEPDHAADMQRNADWLIAELARIGMEGSRTLPNNGWPMVYAEWLNAGEDKPTVLIYAHYDVMPVGPLEEWISPPFEPTRRDGRIYARGAVDDKCGVSITLAALEAMFTANGQLPINIKILFDGAEECGSPGIADFVAANLAVLAADLLIISDGGGQPGQPLIMAGVRGTVSAEVLVYGPQRDLHSGAFGGVVHNPVHLVGKIIASFHDEQGRIAIPGFYDTVRALTPAEDAIVAAAAPLLLQRAQDEAGLQIFWGEAVAPFGVRAMGLPTCDVNGVWGGYQGPGGKTIIPAQAGFKVSMRIVADQHPDQIMRLFADHVHRFAVDTLRIEVIGSTANWHATLLHEGPVIEVLQNAYRSAWGVPARFYRAGGCVPLIGVMQRTLGLPIMDLGYGVGENGHAANEYMEIEYFQRGIETALHFFYGLSGVARAEIGG